MFDWPPQSHTSPTSTLCSSTSWPPWILTEYGPPTGGTPTAPLHLPPAPALPAPAFPSISTRTDWPDLVQPQKVFGLTRWSTMSSPKIGLRNGSGGALAA